MVNNRTLGFDIVVNTQGSDGKITSIKQDINALQAAIEKVSKDSSLTLNIDGFKRNLEEARALQNRFIAQLDQLNSSRIDVANRAANAEAEAVRKQQEYISNLKATQNANANKPVVNVSVQKDNESIRVLQDQLTQMKEQTSLLLNHLGNSGNTTVIATQVSADQVLQILQQNPAALQNILGRQKSAGWR